ncbi:MAG: hypothetical protein GY745_11785 [Actinomycetia bacterium]|nr:hypothetical protein [Actinomycetes bacterium]
MAPPDMVGWWQFTDRGRVIPSNGLLAHFGDMSGVALNQPVVGMVSGADGYLMFASDGGTFAFGQVSFLGSLGGQSIPAPIVGAALNPVIDEYVLADADGRVYRFGP